MNDPVWIEHEDIIALHGQLLARFGGLEGIRDEGMLDSAIGRPQNLFAYGDPSPFEMATAYAFGLVKNHPFLDGKKRIGFVTAAMFMELNGYYFTAPEEEAVIMTRDLAAGIATEEEYTAWLQRSCRKTETQEPL